jgi:polysaccharide deacetylase family protein (PEP-CTERM system associated)
MLIQNALTIDVEDYYHVSGFERNIRREDWGNYPSRVAFNTRRILTLLERHRIKATFFVLGWVADRFPELVRDIDAAGHEIGSHSYWHRLVYHLTPDEFRDDLCRSRDLLQDTIGKPVTSYRTPSFSITARSLWALDILVEEGFTVDSSVFPIRHDRYGIPAAPRQPYVHKSAQGSLWEFPASVARIARLNIPISGGGYFRLFPYRFTSSLLRRINLAQQPFVFYIHPWELDPEQPRLDVSTRAMRFRHYVNLHSTEAKFRRLLTQFSFGRLDEVLAVHVDSITPWADASLVDDNRSLTSSAANDDGPLATAG